MPGTIGVRPGQADVVVDLEGGLAALDARRVLHPALKLRLVLGFIGGDGEHHVADLDVLNGQVLDVAEEAVLDPGIAAPFHLLEGQLVVDRVGERAEGAWGDLAGGFIH